MHASGSSPFTWKIGACTILATSVAYTDRARRLRTGREADLIVDDDVNRAAGAVAGELREVQRLRDDALSGERGVAVNAAPAGPSARLLSPISFCFARTIPSTIGSTASRWRRIRRQRQLHVRAVRRLVHAVGAEVVLHVAGALGRVRIDVAFELVEDLFVRLAEDVGEHVEASAMRHADDRLGARRPAVASLKR